ncbi:hypothetical protein DPMN_089498 [Dreissena polymorpha]|uniref:Uncharacterized protein n=1 Tax=Dreissena polymorpha TaxID=45954 RepID=A0A9D4KYE9_DREPO|nr:hypothetical protein DPMN_089498 [Dreissena polymorpha]
MEVLRNSSMLRYTSRMKCVANKGCPEQFEVIKGRMEQLHQDFLVNEKECETEV